MYWLDTTILVLLGVGAGLGAWSGLVKQVVRVVGFGASLYGAVFFHGWAADYLQQTLLKGADERIAGALSYVVVFLAIFLAFLATALLIERCLKAVKLKWLDRLFGAVVGAVKAALILGAIFLAMIDYPSESTNDVVKQSRMAPILAAGVDVCLRAVPAEYTNDLQMSLDSVTKAADAKAKELRDRQTTPLP